MAALSSIAIGAGAAATLGSAAIGASEAGANRDAAQKATAAALQQIQAIGAPPDLAKAILYQQYKSAGVLTPEMEQAIEQQSSKVADIQENVEGRDAQSKALELLSKQSQTGLTPQDRAAFNKTLQNVQTATQGNREAIMQQMQARGQAGSGSELAAQLAAAQGGSNQMSDQGLQIAGTASERALQALSQYGQQGGQLRSQDFNTQLTKSQAADEMNRFNTQNAQQTQMRNVNRTNEAQAANLANQQAVSNANTDLYNQEQQRQAQALRQNWLDKLSQAQAASGQLNNQAQQSMQSAGQTAQQWQNIGSGLAAGAGAIAAYGKSPTPAPSGTPVTSKDIANYKIPF